MKGYKLILRYRNFNKQKTGQAKRAIICRQTETGQVKRAVILLVTVHCLLVTLTLWAQPLQIVSIYPANGAQGVKTDTLIRITFNKELNKKSAEASFTIAPPVKGKLSWQENTLVFRPEAYLIPSIIYTISLGSAVKDVQSKPLAVSYFTTLDQLLYITEDNIWVANADGSGRRNLTKKAGSYFKPLWLEGNEKIVFESDSDLWIMDRDGGTKQPLTTGKAVISHEFLPSPDGKRVVFLSKNGEIRVVDIGDGKETKIFSPQDPEKNNLGLGCSFVWSPDSKYLLYNRLSKGKILDIWIADAFAKVKKPLTKNRWEGNDWGFRFSPDGAKIAYAIEGALYTMNNDGGDKKKVSGDNELNEDKFSFSPDGTRIIFLANYNIWMVNSDGSNLKQLTEGNNSNYANWLPDGKRIIFTKADEDKNTNNIWLMELAGKKQTPLTKNRIVSGAVEHSGNGDYISFYSTEGTDYYFRIMNIDGTGKQVFFSSKEGPIPKPNPYLWSHCLN